MHAVSGPSRRPWSGAIAACGLLGLAAVALASGHSRVLALAVTDPEDSGALETEINPPLGRPGPAGALPGAAAVHLPAGNPLWAIPLRLLNATRERPLFSPSRRPPPVPVAVVAPPPPPPLPPAEPDHPLLTLIGTVIGDPGGISIFVDQNSKKVIVLKTGQEHDGWTLREVRDRKTVFERNRREAILTLPERNAADTPTAPSVAAAAAVSSGNHITIGTSSKWRDGEGQVISPPAPAVSSSNGSTIGSSKWRDGNGPMISPPAPVLSSGNPSGIGLSSKLITPPPLQVGGRGQH